jgi:hypothetical protein
LCLLFLHCLVIWSHIIMPKERLLDRLPLLSMCSTMKDDTRPKDTTRNLRCKRSSSCLLIWLRASTVVMIFCQETSIWWSHFFLLQCVLCHVQWQEMFVCMCHNIMDIHDGMHLKGSWGQF